MGYISLRSVVSVARLRPCSLSVTQHHLSLGLDVWMLSSLLKYHQIINPTSSNNPQQTIFIFINCKYNIIIVYFLTKPASPYLSQHFIVTMDLHTCFYSYHQVYAQIYSQGSTAYQELPHPRKQLIYNILTIPFLFRLYKSFALVLVLILLLFVCPNWLRLVYYYWIYWSCFYDFCSYFIRLNSMNSAKSLSSNYLECFLADSLNF